MCIPFPMNLFRKWWGSEKLTHTLNEKSIWWIRKKNLVFHPCILFSFLLLSVNGNSDFIIFCLPSVQRYHPLIFRAYTNTLSQPPLHKHNLCWWYLFPLRKKWEKFSKFVCLCIFPPWIAIEFRKERKIQ